MGSLRFFCSLIIVAGSLSHSAVSMAEPETAPPSTNLVNEHTGRNFSAEETYALLVAEMAIYRGEYEVALSSYVSTAQTSQDPQIAKAATQLAVSISDVATSLIPAEIWAKNAPLDTEAQLTVAALLIRMAKPEQAVPYLEQAAQNDSQTAAEQFDLLYQELTQPKDKMQVLQALSLINTEKTLTGEIALGRIYLSVQEYDLAKKHIDTVVSKAPSSNEGIQLKAALLIKQGDPKAGLALLAKANTQKPSFQIQKFYLEMLTEQKLMDQAHAQLKQMKSRADLKAVDALELARLSMESNWLPDATYFLGQAQRDPEYADTANYFLGRVLELEHRVKEAITRYDNVEQGPFHINSHIRAAWLLAEQQQYKDALHLLEDTQPTSNEDLQKVSATKIEILIEMEAYPSAMTLLDNLIQAHPDDLNARVTRSYVAEKMDLIEIIEEDLSYIIKEQPQNVHALNALGYLLADRTTRFQEAEALLKTALALEPTNPTVLDSMGWLKYKQGHTEEALTWLNKAMQIKPDSEIAAHLGEVLWVAGKHQEASAVWQSALEKTPKHSLLTETMDKFKP